MHQLCYQYVCINNGADSVYHLRHGQVRSKHGFIDVHQHSCADACAYTGTNTSANTCANTNSLHQQLGRLHGTSVRLLCGVRMRVPVPVVFTMSAADTVPDTNTGIGTCIRSPADDSASTYPRCSSSTGDHYPRTYAGTNTCSDTCANHKGADTCANARTNDTRANPCTDTCANAHAHSCTDTCTNTSPYPRTDTSSHSRSNPVSHSGTPGRRHNHLLVGHHGVCIHLE